MSKKINKKFQKLFVELDSNCCDKLGVKAGGVTEYINRLENAKYAPKRDIVLDSLNKYRNVRNILAHDPKAAKKNKILTKYDLKWIKKFNKSLKKKNDPISAYLKKARKFASGKKWKKGIIGVVAVAAIAVGGYFGGNAAGLF